MPSVGSLYVSLGINTSQYNAGLNSVQSQTAAAAKNINSHLSSTSQGFNILTANARKAQFAATNLAFQLNDVFTGLASGQKPFQILAQQGGQIVQLFAQGGGVGNVLKAFGTAARGMITPVTAAGAAIAAFGVAVGLVVSRAAANAEQLRKFDFILKGFGTSGLASAAGLQAVAKELRDMGLSADEANTAIEAIARNPRLNPGQAGQIARTGANIGARLGIGTVEGIKTYTDAISAGAEATIDLALKTNALSGAQASNLSWMAKQGQEAKALDLAIAALRKAVANELPASLSDGEKAMRSFSSAWNHMMDNLASTGPIVAANDALKAMLVTMGDLFSGKYSFADTPFMKGLTAFTEWWNSQKGTLALTDADEKERLETIEKAKRASGATPADDRRAVAAAAARLRGQSVPDVVPEGAPKAVPEPPASNRFAIGPLSANTDSLQRLTKVMEAAAETLPAGYRVVATSTKRSGAGGSLHDTGDAMDIQIIDPSGKPLPNSGPFGADPGLYKTLAIAAYNANKAQFPGKPLTWGARFETSPGSRRSDWMHFDTGPERGRFGVPLRDVAGDTSDTGASELRPDQKKILAAADALKLLMKTETEATANAKLWAIEQQAAAAATAERNKALAEGVTAQEAETRAQIAASETRKRAIIDLQKEQTLTDMRVAGINRVTDALKVSEAAAMRQTAIEEARVRAKQTGADPEVLAASALAEKMALKRQDLQGMINDNQRSVDLVRLEDSILGDTSEKISYQLDLLRAKQTLEKSGLSVSEEVSQNYLKSAENLAKVNLTMAQHLRQLDQWKELGSTIEGSFSSIFDTIADGTFKVSSALKTLMKDIGKFLFSSGMKAIFSGESAGGYGAGLFGGLGKLLGIGGGGSLPAGPGIEVNNGIADTIGFAGKYANGGGFTVGGSGGIDSQLVAMRATPGERVKISNDNRGGGSAEVIHLELNPSEGWVAGVADRQIHTRSGAIVRVAVRQSQQLTRRSFSTMAGESQARQA